MIRKDDILKMTEKGISVFRYYLPVDFKVGKNFLNPFYKDTKASCNIYYERKAGVFKMKDFGNEDYSGDCFELVGRLNGLSCKEPKEFVEIMEMINRDLHLGLSAHEEYHVSHSKVPQKSETLYVGAKELYGCGTCLLEQIGNRGKCSESVPDGIAEEVQQREPGKEAFFLHDKRR